MATVSAQTISRHLNNHPQNIFVGPNQTYEYGGSGQNLIIHANGTPTSPNYQANSSVIIDEHGPTFFGEVDLGKAAEVTINGVGAPTSYTYSPQHGNTAGYITFYYGERVTSGGELPHTVALPEYGFKLNIATSGFSVFSMPGTNSVGSSGSILITTGAVPGFPGMAFGVMYGIYQHVPGATA